MSTIQRTKPKKLKIDPAGKDKEVFDTILSREKALYPDGKRKVTNVVESDKQVSRQRSTLLRSTIQVLAFIALVSVIVFAFRFVAYPFPTMPGSLVVLFSLSLAFTWVEVLKIGTVKPFSCLKCMTGWFALIIAAIFHTEFWYFYLFAGLFVGGLFEAVKMRWL